MELFFAGIPNINILVRFYGLTNIKVNILKNYYELRDKDFKKEILTYKPYVNKIMLDSGAFSANNSLKPTEAESIRQRYPIFLKSNADFIKEFIYRVFNYDYRFDQEGFTENFTMFVKLHNSYKLVCPVIHSFTENGENPEVDEYAPFRSPTIAIGQIINKTTETRVDRTSVQNLPALQDTINSIKETNSDCHLFGISSFGALKDLKNYDTCDSTSWNSYARSGNVIIFWEHEPSSSKPFYGTFNFPKHQNTRNSTKPFDTLPKNLQDYFFNDMKNILKLDKFNFYNTTATESLELANLYYSIKFAEYINSIAKPYSTSSNSKNIFKSKSIKQETLPDDSIKNFIDELLAVNPFENHNKEQIEQEVVDKSIPEVNPFEMPKPKETLQEFTCPIPKENPFTSINKEEGTSSDSQTPDNEPLK